MKKVFVLSAKFFSLISVCLCLLLCLAACGGGGGGGASLPDSEYTTHNTGGWGGGGGSGGGGNSGSSNGTITGSTPLNVTEYTYNGQTYTSVEALKNAIAETAPAGQFTIPFTCTNASNETEIRTARITKTVSGNNTEILIEHQYKATITVNGTDHTIPFYMNDGVSLADIAAEFSDETSSDNTTTFPLEQIKIGGVVCDKNGSYPVSSSGDLTISSVTPVYKKWAVSNSSPKTIQFSSSLEENDLIVIPYTDDAIMQIYNDTGKKIKLNLKNMHTNGPNFYTTYINPPSCVTELVFPDSITEIGDSVFYSSTNLTSVTLPNNLQSIEASAFANCTQLSSVTFGSPSSLQTIGEGAFYGTAISGEITIPQGVETIGPSAFSQCVSLTAVSIPNSVTTIGIAAFQTCTSLSNVNIADGSNLTTIGGLAFRNSGVTSIIIPDTVTSIGNSAFGSCAQLSSVTLPTNSSFTSISANTFEGCTSLTSITLPSYITYIENSAFSGCTSLNKINSSSNQINLYGINTVGQSAFAGCTAISSVYLHNGLSLGSNAFNGCTGISTLVGCPSSYANSSFAGCTNINFMNLSGFTSFTISSSLFSGTEKKVAIQLTFPADYTSITIVSSDTITAPTPYFMINGSDVTTLASKITVTPSGSTWGDKDIIVLATSNGKYYKYTATGFVETTAPADWND
ncbi:MAG: leucine-rich repeat domain-containing protein [Spirochaetaceae bacterium]|nr:leucine-rich repeat domain-containing protein [Spirochaetaceae bacterium]